MKQIIFIGNYSKDGITRLEFNNNTFTETLKVGKDINNSYVCTYKEHLYSVVEIGGDENVDSGYVSSYAINGNEVKFVNSKVSYGESPCFLIVDELREILYVANYSGGSFVAFKLDEDGSIGERLYYKKFEDISKVHHVQFSKDYRSVYIVDLGADCIIEYNIEYNQHELKLIEKAKFKFPFKSEPRHMSIDKQGNIYVVTEKSCELYKLKHNNIGQLIMIDKKSILPEGTIKKEDYTGCAIKIDAKMEYVYVSVRGHNSISAFSIKNDDFELVQNISCEGNIPRDIAFDKNEEYLLCANQGSNDISLFSIEEGKLAYQKKYEIETPTCIVVN